MTNDLATRFLELSRLAFFQISHGGHITVWSQASEELYGYLEVEALGRTADFLCFPDQRTILRVETDEPGEKREVERHRHRDGTELFVELRLKGSRDGLLVCAQDVSSERLAAAGLRSNREALEANRHELRRLAGRILDAQEGERQRIASDLHDDFQQRLAALGLQLATLAETSGANTPEPIQALVSQVKELGDEIRRISHQLHPAALERLGLAAALESHASEVEARRGLAVRVTLRDAEAPLPRNVALGLYRVAQEALENAARHSGARQAHLTLVRDVGAPDQGRMGGTIRLAIADDGAGFDPEEARAQGGLGLTSMEERARLLGGQLRLTSGLGAGTEIEVVVPLEGETSETHGEAGGTKTGAQDDTDRAPRLIGPYRLLEVLGEGATATVYLAEEPPPLERKVAIKLYRVPRAGHREVLSFKAERQALARLRHPNVGQIHEARTTEEGNPYLVMEHVPGMPITDYCDRYRLSLRQRIELFVAVCEGVQHVHQKGVLHRDLKPSNVLVMEQNGKPVPKIVDFGIAKGLDQPLAEGTVWTRGAVGTPAYVPPEVLAGGETDTRGDVYALGVMLYELLTGVLPIQTEAEALGQLAGNPLQIPSRRLATLEASEIEGRAAERRARGRELTTALRGDLDWIAAKALAPEPEARYVGTAALANDLERHLRSEPVLAGPPTLSYRLTRLARRQRAAVAAAALGLLALVGGLVATTWQARRTAQQAAAAEEAHQEAEQISEFLEELFEVSDPNEAQGNTITAREILDRGAERLDRELAGQPRTQARLQETVGSIYRRLGLFDTARELLEGALTRRRDLFGEDHLETARSLRALARVHIDDGRFDEGRPLLERALAIQEEILGKNDLEVAETLDALALVLRRARKTQEAARLYRRVHDIVSSTLPPEHPRAIMGLVTLGLSYDLVGQGEQAMPHYQRARELGEEHLGPDHPTLFVLLNHMANLHSNLGQGEQAAAVFEQLVPRLRRVLGPQHSHTLNIRLNLAGAYQSTGNTARAREEAAACLEESHQALGLRRMLAIRSASVLGKILYRRGEYAQAEEAYQRSVELAATTEKRDPHSLAAALGLAQTAFRTQRFEAARELARSALALAGDDPSWLHLSVGSRHVLADIALELGDLEEAERWSRELQSALEVDGGFRYSLRDMQTNRIRLGKILATRGDTEGARQSWELVVELAAAWPGVLDQNARRAIALLLLGRVAEAKPVAQQALRGHRHPDLIALCERHGIEVPPLDG